MDVLMPQIGETVSEGKVITWFKSVGDKVQAGDILFEIETDKATVEIQATDAGVLSEIRVPMGVVAPVGAIVAIIGDGSGSRAAGPAPAAVVSVRKAAAPAQPPPAAAAPGIPPAPVKLDPY